MEPHERELVMAKCHYYSKGGLGKRKKVGEIHGGGGFKIKVLRNCPREGRPLQKGGSGDYE